MIQVTLEPERPFSALNGEKLNFCADKQMVTRLSMIYKRNFIFQLAK
jgi:hypothetical protein